MKKQLAMISLSLVLSSSAFSWSQWDSCHEQAGFDDTYCSTCQCTDPNYGSNNCVSLNEYCEAFGNVGDL